MIEPVALPFPELEDKTFVDSGEYWLGRAMVYKEEIRKLNRCIARQKRRLDKLRGAEQAIRNLKKDLARELEENVNMAKLVIKSQQRLK